MKYLDMILALNRRRNRGIQQQTIEIVLALNSRGIRPILMKCGIFLFEDWADCGLPMMVDVDVLLDEKEIPLATAILHSIGYINK